MKKYQRILGFIAALLTCAPAFASPAQNVQLGSGNELPALTTGINNLAIGNVSSQLTTGSNNILIGTNSLADVTAASTSNSLFLGGGSTAILSASNISTTPVVSIPGIFQPGIVATQGQAFSTALSGNPLLLDTVQNVPIASINAAGFGFSFLSGVTGRTIFPHNIILTALGGTCATATNVKVQCTSGNNVGTFPVAALVSAVGTQAFQSSGTTLNTVGAGYAGCASGDGVFISTTGSALATCASILVNMSYTVQ